MKNKFLLIFLLGILGFTAGNATNTNYYYNAASGLDITNVNNWWLGTGYTGAHPTNFTTASQTFNITGAGSYTLAAAWTVSGTSSLIQVGDGANICTLTIPSSYALAGPISVAALATLTDQNTTTIALGTLSTGSTVIFSASGAQTVPSATYSNLTISNTGGAIAAAAGNLTVNGVLTISASSTLNMVTYSLVGGITASTPTTASSITSGSTSVTLAAGNVNILPGMTVMGAGIAPGTTVAAGYAGGTTLTLSKSANVTSTATSVKLTFNFSTSGTGTLQTQATGSTALAPANYTFGLMFNNTVTASAQDLPNGECTFANITVANTFTGAVTNFFGASNVTGVITIYDGCTLAAGDNVVSGTFTTSNVGGTTSTGSGKLTTTCATATSATPLTAGITYNFEVDYISASTQTVVAGNYLNLNVVTGAANRTYVSGGTFGIAGVFTPSTGTNTTTGTTFIFNGTTAQTIPTLASYNNLSVTNTGGTVTAGGTITLAAAALNLNIASGATLDMSTYQLIGSTTTTQATPATAGSITVNSTTVTLAATNANILVGQLVTGTGIASGTTVAAINTTTLTLSQPATATNSVAITLTFGFATSGTGTLKTAFVSGSTLAIPSGKCYTFNVNYYAATGAQYLNGVFFGGLTFSNTSGTNTATGGITVNGVLTIPSGSTLNMSTYSVVAGISSPNAAITSGSTAVTLSAANSNIQVGMTVTGNNIPAGTTVNAISGTSLTLSGTGATGSSSTTYSLSFNFSTSGTGTLATQVLNSSSAIAPAATISGTGYSFTILMNGAGNQTLAAGNCTYSNLTIANSAGYHVGTFNNTTITGVLTINDGDTLTGGGVLSGGFTTANNGSGTGVLVTTCATSTSATPLPAGITYNFGVNYSSTSAQTIVAGTYTNLNASGYAATTYTGTTITITVASATGIIIGQTATGPSIPASTTVTGISGTSITLSNAPTASGWVVFSGGGSRTLSSTGTIAVSGTFTPSFGAYTTTGSTVSLSGNGTLPSFTSGNYNNLIIAGSGTTTASATLTVGGNFTINSGATFTAPSGNFNVAGNWSNAGTFTHNSGNVVLNGTSQIITGTNTFNNFTKSVGIAATLTFPAGLTQTFAGTLTLNGSSGQLLTIKSSTGSSVATINAGTSSVAFVTASWCTNTGTNILATNSTDGGNNTGWTFTAGPVWIGATSANWNDASNWVPASVPLTTDIVTITKSGSNDLSIETSPTVASITISAGNSVSLQNGQILTLNGGFTNNGSFTGNATSTVVVANSSSFSGTGTTNLNNLTINSSKTLTESAIIGISGTLTNSGTFTASTGTVNFNGTAAQTVPTLTYYNLTWTSQNQKGKFVI